MKKFCILGLAALLAAPMAFAQQDMPSGGIIGYATRSDLDVEGAGSDDGIGFGVRGWASIQGGFFAHGEYQTTGLDGLDLESLRIGGGYAGPIAGNAMWMAKAELVDFGSDTDEDGFGIHGGAMFEPAPKLGLFGSLGFLSLNDTDGLELNVGAHYAFTREFAGVADVRYFMGEYDTFGVTGDFEVMDLRVGVAYLFYY